MVRRARRRPPVAPNTRPVRDPRLRGDAPADAGEPGRAALRGLARALARRPRARRGFTRGGDPRVAGARVQPPRPEPAPRRTRRCRARLAGRPDRAAGRRPLHGRRGARVRARRRRAAARHERAADRGADRPQLRPVMRTGADGPRTHDLPRARAALRRVPARRAVPVPRPALRAAAQAVALRGLVPPAPRGDAAARRRVAAPARRSSTARRLQRSSGTVSSRPTNGTVRLPA